MGIGLHRSGSPAQPGWVWGSSARSQGPPPREGGIPGSGRKAGMSQRAPGRSAELGPAVLVGLCRLSSLPGTSLWAGCHEQEGRGGGVPCPYPGISQSSSKPPVLTIPTAPWAPATPSGGRRMGGAVWLLAACLGSLPGCPTRALRSLPTSTYHPGSPEPSPHQPSQTPQMPPPYPRTLAEAGAGAQGPEGSRLQGEQQQGLEYL